MQTIMYNSRGQEAGVLDNFVYRTSRNLFKGQIFCQKHHFGNRYFKHATAIDEFIVNKLIDAKCHTIEILIIGIGNSFYVKITPEKVLEVGIKMTFDKRKQGINYTGYGVQYVFGIYEDCIPINQMRLMKDEK